MAEGDAARQGSTGRDAPRHGALPRFLILASVLYLALPYAIVFVGCPRWYFALLGFGLLAIPLFDYIRRMDRSVERDADRPDSLVLGWRHIILVLVISVVLLAISGIGGYGYQDTDWPKHNAILKDLIEQPWPAVYQVSGRNVPLVYYLAYYLPAALLGKFGGWFFANQVLFVWSLIGLALALQWFLVLVRRGALLVLLLFVAFSGLDIIGEWLVLPAIVALRPQYASLVDWTHIERWAMGWEYSSNVTLMFWVPNQAFVGWIATALLLYAILYSGDKKFLLFYYGLTALWSPFVTIGLAPFLLMGWLLENGTWLERFKRYAALPNLSGLGLLAIVGLFYGAKLYPISPLVTGEIPQGFSLLAYFLDTQAKMIGLVLILVFCLLEFGLNGILIFGSRRAWDAKTKALFVTTMISLSLIPFYRYGAANDFSMRASIPALFALALLLGRTLHSHSLTIPRRLILTALVLIGSATAAIEIQRHVRKSVAAGTLVQTPEISQVSNDWIYATRNRNSILLQYTGSSQAPFFRFMAKPLPAVEW